MDFVDAQFIWMWGDLIASLTHLIVEVTTQ